MSMLVMVIVASVVVALASFTTTSTKSRSAYDDVRTTRYAAAGAVNAAINWAKSNPNAGVDADYQPGAAADCVYQVDGITVSCAAEANSESGIPADQGLVPPEALLVLGDRQTEPGPYSFPQCSSLFDSIANFFTGYTPGFSENGLHLKKQQRSQWGGIASCAARNRPVSQLLVTGDVVSAGTIRAEDSLTATNTGSPAGSIFARHGCSGLTCSTSVGTRADGTARDSDPGRANPSAINGHIDLKTAYRPIGFNADGTLQSGFSLPSRTTAYRYVASDTTNRPFVPAKLVPIAQCTDALAGEPIIFLPGWYRDSEVLSRYTSNSSCPDRTFWFAPDPGADNVLLTDDDRTGPFYLDFAGTTGRACGDLPNRPTSAVYSRWCLGGSATNASTAAVNNSKPRAVVGTPADWSPFGTVTTGGTGTEPPTGSRVSVRLDTASTVDGGFLSYWTNQANAKKIDGTVSTFSPCSLLFGLITCPSFGERTLRVQGFSPHATGGPIGDAGYPNGRVYLNVSYGLLNAGGINVPKVVVEALDSQGTAKQCGSYDLSKDSRFAYSGSGAFDSASHTYTFSDVQAKALADACGAVDMINNLKVSLQVSGNTWNSGGLKLFLDGVSVSYDSYRGASFPIGTDGVANSTAPARSDCDPKAPGGQFILGGESNIFVADGSLEICAGPFPDAAATHQSIGILGVPAVQPLRPTTVTLDSASSGSGSTVLENADGARRIGEPAATGTGPNVATIKYPGRCLGAVGIGPCNPVDGGAKEIVASFPKYTPPTGYRVKRIEARVAYEAEGPVLSFDRTDAADLKAGACTEDVRTTEHNLVQWANEGRNNATKLVLYEHGTTRNCISPTTLTDVGATVRWKATVPGGFGVVFGGRCFVFIGSCSYTQADQLDGIELDVTLEPIDSTVPMLRPQSGCITAHPNYGGGDGQPDCAAVRAESYNPNDTRESLWCSTCSTSPRGQWNGRVSVKGTIYAPSAAMSLDDSDVAYPLATRGAILRHLRISGWGVRSGYTAPAISNQLDTTPNDRRVIFTACVHSDPARADLPCDPTVDSDIVLTTALVSFRARTTTAAAADVPYVESWLEETKSDR